MLIFPNKDLRYSNEVIKANQILYSKYVLRLIQNAFVKKEQFIQVFAVKDTDVRGMIYKKDYEKVLKLCMDTFIKHEEYELAEKTTKLIDKIRIQNLLEET